jgi:hypothetical protein
MAFGRSILRRASKTTPLGRGLLAAEVALIAGRHVGRLSGEERRRLVVLLGEAAGHRGHLEPADRRELACILAKLQPRLFVGTAVRRVSPVPIPARVLYGRKDNPARRAARLGR